MMPRHNKGFVSESSQKYEPKRIIICCDGTGQSSTDFHWKQCPPSNVERLCQVIARAGKDRNGNDWQQVVYYNTGVGTGNLTFIDRLRQGAFGIGLHENVREIYSFIASNYSPGDELFFFGFSQGAYTAHLLVGLICDLGILKPTWMNYFYNIYDIYQRKPAGNSFKDFPEWQQYSHRDALEFYLGEVVIRVIGVWDMVSSLGIPDIYWLDLSRFRKKHEFHSISLHSQIKHAFHALALDETRSVFKPTLWQLPKSSSNEQSSLCQVWFPGTHIDIGCGNSDNIMGPALSGREHLTNITFAWMIDRIQPYIALCWDKVKDLLGRVEEDNNIGYAAGIISRPPWSWWLLNKPESRTPSRYHDKERFYTCEYIHESVYRRQQRSGLPHYNPAALNDWTREQVSNGEGQGYRWKWINKTEDLSLPELGGDLFGLWERYGNGQESPMATEIFSHLVQVRKRERTTSGPEPPEHEGPFPSVIPISSGNDGIQVLSALVNLMQGQTQNQDDPIVLVSGFSGWGRPLFGTINYWGGFEDLPAILAQVGYKVIVVRIGPVSSNRERACEIWTQLRNINNGTDRGYDRPTDVPTRININYGNQHPAAPLGFLRGAWTWRPVLFGDVPENWNWTWGNERPVHFICHSQGGNSVRFLIELLTGTHTDLFPGPDFPADNHQDWVRSVVTIGTPYKGTTVTDVVQNLFPQNFFEVLTRLVWSTSFDPPESRFYDLQLDHWGFCRQENESLSAMYNRLVNLVPFWWNSNLHGLHDNSILGVASLNDFAPDPSQHTYYFTMSFCATDPFPNRTLGRQDVNEFLALFPLDQVFNPFGWWGIASPIVFRIFSRLLFLPQLRDFAAWFTDVANRHLGSMNYFSRIPHPGSQIPRADMLPVIALPAYAMGGYQLDQQRLQTVDCITSEEYQRNDGIVNTKSMSGPVNAEYGADPFPGPGIDMTNMARAKGKYWHLGENVTIDHADQIGVFTFENTAIEVSFMYLLFASLVTRLQ